MRKHFRPKYIVLIGVCVILAGVTGWYILSRQQARLADVEWSITQRRLSPEDAQTLAPSVEEARDRKFSFYEIDTPELKQLFPAATFYVICAPGDPPTCSREVAVQAGHAYRLPQDFNRLLLDAGIHITDDNALPIVRAFVGTAQRGMLLGMHINFIQQMALDEADIQLPQYHYQWAIQAWAREFGTVTDWKIGFRAGQIEIALRTLLGRQVGTAHSSDNAEDYFSSGGISIHAIPRRDSEYYLCCSPQGQLLMSYSLAYLCCDQHGQLSAEASLNQAPSPSGTLPIELVAEWQTPHGWSATSVEADSWRTARQAYPDQVNETWAQPWSVEWISPALVQMASRQWQDALFPGVPDQVHYLVQASPFSLTAVPSASYVGIVASQGNKVYRLPEDFNLLLTDVGPSLTPANQVSVAQAFIWATHRELVTTLGSIFLTDPKTIDETDPLHPTYHYQLEMDSWARERGVWVKWKFGFADGRIAVVHYTVLGRFVGSWQSQLHPNVLDPFFTPDAKYFVCCDEKGVL